MWWGPTQRSWTKKKGRGFVALGWAATQTVRFSLGGLQQVELSDVHNTASSCSNQSNIFFFRASSLFFPLWTLVSWVYNFLFSAALPCFFLPPSPSLPVWTCKLHLAACSLLLLPQLTPILIKLLLPPPPLSVWAFSTHARLLLKMEPLTCIGNGKKNKQKNPLTLSTTYYKWGYVPGVFLNVPLQIGVSTMWIRR